MMKIRQIHTETIKDQIYQILRQQIMDGTLHPGDRIVEQDVADQLGVSRSPVREAIKQLIGDGLLCNIPNRGAFVKKLTAKEVQDTYDMRVLLEEYAIMHIDPKLREKNRKQLQKMKDRIDREIENLSVQEYETMDQDVHVMIIRLCGNQVIADTYDTLWGKIAFFRSISLMSKERQLSSLQGHAMILASLLDGDDQKAYETLRIHLEDAQAMIQDILRNYASGKFWI